MADITISYKNDDIAEISQSGTVTLDTSGKYCEDDITIEYVKPAGGIDYMAQNVMDTLTTYSSDEVTTVRAQAFRDSSITRVTFPNCTKVNGDAFRGTHITGFYAADFPLLEETGNGGFGNLGSYPQFACFPKVGKIEQTGISGSGLQAVDVGNANVTPVSIAGSAFNGNSLMTTLILRYTSIISLSALTAFINTPFASGGNGGTIYIPESLYNHLGDESALDYKAATNWSVIDGYGTITWAKIEGSQYETKYADGTDIITGGD